MGQGAKWGEAGCFQAIKAERQGAGEMSEDTGMLLLVEAFRRVTVSLLFTFLSALPFSFLLLCPHPSLKLAGWVSG